MSDKNCTFSFFFQSSPYKSNEAVGRRRYLYLELALVSFALVPLEQHLTVRVRVDLHSEEVSQGSLFRHHRLISAVAEGWDSKTHRDPVQRVQFTRAVEHVFVHLAVVPSQAAIELPIRERPRIRQPDRVRPDLLEQAHHLVRPRQLNLPDGDGGTREELARFLLQRVQRPQPEQLLHDFELGLAQLRARLARLQRGVEVFDDEVLAVCF